jgi:16S rRNA (adenine1518-N6/adenine1519-N6)-dimethyltransferase
MTLQEICKKYNIQFKKQLGQNLLLDDNINRIMVDAAGLDKEIDVVEIGAGLGALTKRLYPLARRVLAIEIDRTFMPVLEDFFTDVENVVLFRGDALNHTPRDLVEEHLPGAARLSVVANLPYYITTPLLFHFWESDLFFERLVVMVQEEVGLRMVAGVGDSDYSVLSIAAQLYGDVDIVHRVPASCFRPKPKVDSAIVRVRNRKEPRYTDLTTEDILRVVRKAFGQRRKTLRNTLTRDGGLGIPGEAVLEVMEAAGLDPGRRPQTLSIDEFAGLARGIKHRRNAGVPEGT